MAELHRVFAAFYGNGRSPYSVPETSEPRLEASYCRSDSKLADKTRPWAYGIGPFAEIRVENLEDVVLAVDAGAERGTSETDESVLILQLEVKPHDACKRKDGTARVVSEGKNLGLIILPTKSPC